MRACSRKPRSPGSGFITISDDGNRNTVGQLECGRYIILADPNTGTNRAIVEEHWTYAIRSAAATTLPLKWLGPKDPKVVGIVGVGTMATNALRCLVELYDGIEEIRCTSRNPKTREAFAEKVVSETRHQCSRKRFNRRKLCGDADIGIGGTTSDEIMCREPWLKPSGRPMFPLPVVSLTQKAGHSWIRWLVDSWEMNMLMKHFRATAEAGIFTRDMLHGEIHELVRGKVAGRDKRY